MSLSSGRQMDSGEQPVYREIQSRNVHLSQVHIDDLCAAHARNRALIGYRKP